MSMDVLTEASAQEARPDKGLIFLYRLVSGKCTQPPAIQSALSFHVITPIGSAVLSRLTCCPACIEQPMKLPSSLTVQRGSHALFWYMWERWGLLAVWRAAWLYALMCTALGC